MIIREAIPTDAARICEIWNPVIRETLATFTNAEKSPASMVETLAQKAAQNHPFLLACDADTLLGFATYGPFRNGPGYAYTMEHTIILAPEARGQGTGRALMQALEEKAKARKIHSLFAGISAANPKAVAFHASCGFNKITTLPEVGYKFDRWLDLVLMQKLL